MSQTRGYQSAVMAAKFLSAQLTPAGLLAFAAELDRRLAQPHGAVDLTACRFVLENNPAWFAEAGMRLPGAVAAKASKARARQRKRAA